MMPKIGPADQRFHENDNLDLPPRVRRAMPDRFVPDLTIVSGVPDTNGLPISVRGPSLLVRVGKRLRGVFDWVIARSSLVANDPVLDARDFEWTSLLRDHWRDIRDEAVSVALHGDAAPSLATISPDHRGIAEVDKWRSFFLYGYGYAIEDNLARCPRTAAIVARIPGLNTAFFSILAPGTHIPDHRGVTKGLITCHLGLIVPTDGDVRMRVHDRIVRWAEGETLVFDDTYRHEVWHEATTTRVVLLIQVERPLRQPGKWFADVFLGFARRSTFVQEARRNILSWNAAIGQLDG